MYSVALKKRFSARHFLIGGDFGPEGKPHSHEYQVEVQLATGKLNAQGFVLDIVELGVQMEQQIGYFRNRVLNELDEFRGQNPSLEYFCRIFCERILGQFDISDITSLKVIIWEDDNAWASYSRQL